MNARPAERYGTARPWLRPVTIAAVVLLTVIGGAWLLWAAIHHARPDVASRLTSFQVIDAGTVSATIEIERRTGAAATCVLTALATDHGVVGEVRANVPSGDSRHLTLTYEIPTERRATAAELEGCTAAAQRRSD